MLAGKQTHSVLSGAVTIYSLLDIIWEEEVGKKKYGDSVGRKKYYYKKEKTIQMQN